MRSDLLSLRPLHIVDTLSTIQYKKNMIENTKIDGFKSLKDFKINFTKGLNVLVGPNGSGKTNICQAITIFSAIAKSELTETFTSLGGIRSTFDRACDSDEHLIKLEAKGSSFTKSRGKEIFDLTFAYSINLIYKDDLEIKSETLEIKRKSCLLYTSPSPRDRG